MNKELETLELLFLKLKKEKVIQGNFWTINDLDYYDFDFTEQQKKDMWDEFCKTDYIDQETVYNKKHEIEQGKLS